MNDWKAELDAKAQAVQDAAERRDPMLVQDRINAEPQYRYKIVRLVEEVVVEVYDVSAFSDAEALRIAAQIADVPGGRLHIEAKTQEAPQ